MQLRQSIEHESLQNVSALDQLVLQLYDGILETTPSSAGESVFLAEFLVEQLSKFQDDTPLARRTGEKIVSLVSQNAQSKQIESDGAEIRSVLAEQPTASAGYEEPR